MNNKFLEELSHKPIVNTFKLAYKMLMSNKFLFSVITIVFVSLSIFSFTLPFIIRGATGQISILVVSLIVMTFSIVSQVFTEANYLYVCKIVLDSDNKKECIAKMARTHVLPLFSNYFTRAMGSSIALMLIITPFILMREELNMGEYFLGFLLLLLLLALYVYPLVAYKITQSKNFKEAFLVTFSFFSLSVWKQSFNFSYAKFVVFWAVILSGIYYLLVFIIDNVPDVDYSVMSISFMVIMTMLSMFFALYVLPISMMIAHNISTDKKGN